MNIIWKAQILEMAESDIFCVVHVLIASHF